MKQINLAGPLSVISDSGGRVIVVGDGTGCVTQGVPINEHVHRLCENLF